MQGGGTHARTHARHLRHALVRPVGRLLCLLNHLDSSSSISSSNRAAVVVVAAAVVVEAVELYHAQRNSIIIAYPTAVVVLLLHHLVRRLALGHSDEVVRRHHVRRQRQQQRRQPGQGGRLRRGEEESLSAHLARQRLRTHTQHTVGEAVWRRLGGLAWSGPWWRGTLAAATYMASLNGSPRSLAPRSRLSPRRTCTPTSLPRCAPPPPPPPPPPPLAELRARHPHNGPRGWVAVAA